MSEADRPWLREILGKIEATEGESPEPFWFQGEWPPWVQSLSKSLLRVLFPTIQINPAWETEPGAVAAILAQWYSPEKMDS